MSFRLIGQHREAVLAPLVADNNAVAIYNYLPRSVRDWPYVCIIPQEWAEVIRDSIDNENNYPFMIKVVNNNIKKEAESEADMREIVDETLAIIRKNYTFIIWSNKVHRVTFSYSWWRWDNEYKTRMCDITVNNFILKDIL